MLCQTYHQIPVLVAMTIAMAAFVCFFWNMGKLFQNTPSRPFPLASKIEIFWTLTVKMCMFKSILVLISVHSWLNPIKRQACENLFRWLKFFFFKKLWIIIFQCFLWLQISHIVFFFFLRNVVLKWDLHKNHIRNLLEMQIPTSSSQSFWICVWNKV